MTATTLTDEMVETYRRDGVVKVPQIITRDEVTQFRKVSMDLLEPMPQDPDRPFNQKVNVWRDKPVLKQLTQHPHVAAAAEKLAAVRLRIWHDHILAKMPALGVPTAFHQDLVKWPYDRRAHALSAWIALQDTPVEMGCMSFVQGSHRMLDVQDMGTSDQDAWWEIAPEIGWRPRVTLPLQAGDCTFHHGMTFHTAGPNQTEDWRVGFVIIFVDVGATYTGEKHVVTDPLQLEPDTLPPDDMFPPVAAFYQQE
jgi:ectoine hydroxylase-related dioxygenase (phytanoyl-CoA dioxygenase family)